MGFTTPCFIRKNTPELQKKLEELGYIICPDKENGGRYLFAINGMFDYAHNEATLAFLKSNYGYIDCGINESLFIALAAKRDGTSDNQYWIFDEDFNKWKKGDFAIGRFGRCSCYCHVATVEELIEHFKNKE